MEKIYLIDAFALIFKFHYAFMSRPMRNSAGLNTSAIYGFTKFINNIITRESPHYLGVAFDPRGGNFRHRLYPEYKANRGETPEDIIASIPHIKRILEAMRIPILEVADYEADDVIGTISNKAACHGFEVFMVTPDKDYGQLIQKCCYMYKPSRKGEGIEIVGLPELYDNYGITDPMQIIDILALWGDVSDNIPGVPGIGEKTAVKLINEYGSVENIIASADQLKGKLSTNIKENIERLKLAKILVTIDRNVPIDFEPDKLRIDEPLYDELRKIYVEMGFSSLLGELNMWEHSKNNIPPEEREITAEECGCDGIMLSMFDDVPNMALSRIKPRKTKITPIKASEEASVPQDLFTAGNNNDDGKSSLATTSHSYTLIRDVEGVSRLASLVGLKREFAFDTETTGLNTLDDSLVGISISIEPFKAYYIALNPKDKDATIAILEPLRSIFASTNISKIGQNLKFDISMLTSYGFEVNGFLIDTMILHYLLESDERHSMDYLSEKYLNYIPISIEDLIGKGAKQTTMDTVDVEIVAEYAAEDADVTYRLKEILWPACEKEGLIELYKTIEEPLIKVLIDMERAGITIDTDVLDSYKIELQKDADHIENEICLVAGSRDININSAKQIGELLFEKLKIEDKPKLTKTKQYRTDEEYLQSLSHKHPVIEQILEYRGIKKLLTTYVEALPLLVNRTTGRLHTTYNQTIASTGRLSSNNPNLQNIPIRDERGKRIREAFVAVDDSHMLLSADYSQIELRIMAALSGDEALISAFNHSEDIHKATAAKIFGKPLEEVTSDERRAAKTANFGIIYGISAFGLAGRLDISRSEAKALIDGYFESYPRVKEYMDKVVIEAREKGYVETIFGRRKKLADINSSSSLMRSYAERNAINSPIQGSAADIIKIAMSRLNKSLKEKGLKSKLLLQVHDELIVEFPLKEKDAVIESVLDSMEHAAELSVKMVAEYGVAENWLKAH